MKFVKNLSPHLLYSTLLAFGALVSIYFWIRAGSVFLTNHSLNGQGLAHITRWEVEEESSNRYRVVASFSFEENGRTFEGKTRFDHPVYLNADSAIAAVQEKVAVSRPETVWFNRSDPSLSSLQRKPMANLLLRALAATGVWAYFVTLRSRYSKPM